MTSYQLFQYSKFDLVDSIGSKVETPQKQAIEGSQAEPYTSVEKLAVYDYGRYKFQVLAFDHESTMRGTTVRVAGREDYYDDAIRKRSFEGYICEEHNLLILACGKDKANSAMKRLKRHFSTKIDYERGEVDFPFLVQRVDNVVGGWISDLPHTNVTSVGLFGDHVNLSDDFSRHQAVGSLRALYIHLVIDGIEHRFLISRDRSVVIFQPGTIAEDLQTIMALRPLLWGTNSITF